MIVWDWGRGGFVSLIVVVLELGIGVEVVVVQ
jgi:hypothetical protein